MFIILGDCAVVFLAALMIVHPLQDLLHLGRHGHRGAHAVGAVQRVVQVFDMFTCGMASPTHTSIPLRRSWKAAIA